MRSKKRESTITSSGMVEPDRAKCFYNTSLRLNLLSDKRLHELLAQGTKTGSGYGDTLRITIDGTPLFVKQVLLTDLECLPKNSRSTRNMFNLPVFYQYGVGSAGFGAWRELAAHIMTTNWVLSGECPNFPLLYHWRILPRSQSSCMSAEELEQVERDAAHWDNVPAIQARLEALQHASMTVTLFLEYIPDRLSDWLGKEFAQGDAVAQEALKMVLSNFESITDFMRSHEFIHFDAHFENVLTDGKMLYLTDFGLALSTAFELSGEEQAFFKEHRNYDLYYGLDHIMHAIIREKVAKSQIKNREEYMYLLSPFAQKCSQASLPGFFQELLTRYAPLAVIHSDFMHKLISGSKSTPYPGKDLDRAYRESLRK